MSEEEAAAAGPEEENADAPTTEENQENANEEADANTDPQDGDEATNPPPKPPSQHLNLKVKAQDGTEVYFKVKKTTKLKKLMDAYCARVGKEAGSIRFLFDGERIGGDSTPDALGMEDEGTPFSLFFSFFCLLSTPYSVHILNKTVRR